MLSSGVIPVVYWLKQIHIANLGLRQRLGCLPGREEGAELCCISPLSLSQSVVCMKSCDAALHSLTTHQTRQTHSNITLSFTPSKV